jgi:hypothetical protein
MTFGPFTGTLNDWNQLTRVLLLTEGEEKPELATQLMDNYKIGDVPTIEYVVND